VKYTRVKHARNKSAATSGEKFIWSVFAWSALGAIVLIAFDYIWPYAVAAAFWWSVLWSLCWVLNTLFDKVEWLDDWLVGGPGLREVKREVAKYHKEQVLKKES